MRKTLAELNPLLLNFRLPTDIGMRSKESECLVSSQEEPVTQVRADLGRIVQGLLLQVLVGFPAKEIR